MPRPVRFAVPVFWIVKVTLALATRAVAEGSDFRLNGRKLWITNAQEAGLFIVFANANFRLVRTRPTDYGQAMDVRDGSNGIYVGLGYLF